KRILPSSDGDLLRAVGICAANFLKRLAIEQSAPKESEVRAMLCELQVNTKNLAISLERTDQRTKERLDEQVLLDAVRIRQVAAPPLEPKPVKREGYLADHTT